MLEWNNSWPITVNFCRDLVLFPFLTPQTVPTQWLDHWQRRASKCYVWSMVKYYSLTAILGLRSENCLMAHLQSKQQVVEMFCPFYSIKVPQTSQGWMDSIWSQVPKGHESVRSNWRIQILQDHNETKTFIFQCPPSACTILIPDEEYLHSPHYNKYWKI